MIVRALGIQLVAAIGLAGVLAVAGGRRTEARTPMMKEWTVEDLVAHLHKSGVEFRAVPTFEKASVNSGAFLTTTDKPWDQLNTLRINVNEVDRWHGTVFCARAAKQDGTEILYELWGEGGTRVGPFVLFGDPELRVRIEDAL
jgi:hypothetical protein